MGAHGLACLFLGCLLVAPAFAQPDFAAAFNRLDRDDDGLVSLNEVRWEGVDAHKYLEPVGTFITDDGFGVELWRTPFGVRETSTPASNLDVLAAQRLRTFPRDRRPGLIPFLMLAANPELSTMTLERFESELRRASEQRMKQDLNGDGGVSEDELRSTMTMDQKLSGQLSAKFQTGPGGDAMRAKKLELTIEIYAGYDRNADGKVTQDELLECWLSNLVAAYALPE